MNCDEVIGCLKRMLNANPRPRTIEEAMTLAERMASRKHVQSCAHCQAGIKEMIMRFAAKGQVSVGNIVRGMAQAIKDDMSNDPEKGNARSCETGHCETDS